MEKKTVYDDEHLKQSSYKVILVFYAHQGVEENEF